jgi:hypothetical protein
VNGCRYGKRNDGSYYAYFAGTYLGIVRRIADHRWIATRPTMPPEAEEYTTRKAATSWLKRKMESATKLTRRCREWVVTYLPEYLPEEQAHPGIQCTRPEGHEGKHQATYSRGTKTYTVTWCDDDD